MSARFGLRSLNLTEGTTNPRPVHGAPAYRGGFPQPARTHLCLGQSGSRQWRVRLNRQRARDIPDGSHPTDCAIAKAVARHQRKAVNGLMPCGQGHCTETGHFLPRPHRRGPAHDLTPRRSYHGQLTARIPAFCTIWEANEIRTCLLQRLAPALLGRCRRHCAGLSGSRRR